MQVESKTKKLTESAVMLSLATVLSFICIYQAPFGGKVTLGSMVPIIILCARQKEFRISLLSCFAYSLIQMIFEFAAPPTKTLPYFFAVILLDYIVAFTVLSVSGAISRLFKNKCIGVGLGAAVAVTLRFLCHFTTGIFIWGGYAPEGMPVWIYSLIYNGGYMLPEFIVTTVLSVAIFAIIEKKKS